MANILSIETSTKVCSVALHYNGELIALKESYVPNSHSELINNFIKEVLNIGNCLKNDISAICISSGPGSYTGLRIGTSTAKGLCFSLNIPLIAIDTLRGIAQGIIENNNEIGDNDIICPMIDARRMEVYCSYYLNNGEVIKEPHAKIIDEMSFSETLSTSNMYMFGDGSNKCINLLNNDKIIHIKDIMPSAANFGILAFNKFSNNKFEDLAYFEPFYLKEFHTIPSKKNLLLTK